MIEERAIVTQVLSDAVVIESVVKSSCTQCQQVDKCGNGQVAKALPQKNLSLTIPTSEKFSVGDEVLIAIPEQYLLKSAWQVYMWPMMGLISFAGFGQFMLNSQWLSHEWQVIVLAIIGGFIGSKTAKWWQISSGLQEKLMPKITGKISKELFTQVVS